MDEATYQKEKTRRHCEHEAALARTLSDEQLADAILEARKIKNWRLLNALETEFEHRWGSG